MNRSLIALFAVAVLVTFASPATAALSPQACSVLQQAAQQSPNLQGALNNSGCPGISNVAASSTTATVTASEPLTLLAVGLGLLGAGLLSRRRPAFRKP